MMYRDPVFAEHKRNKAENYLSTVKRDQIIDEARLVFAAQRQYGATWLRRRWRQSTFVF